MTVTKVERASLWDEDSRQAAYAHYDDQKQRCPDCGQLKEICSNPELGWHAYRTKCWATAALTFAVRRRKKLTEKETPDEAGFLPTDGERVAVSHVDVHPDDDFLQLGLLGQSAQPDNDDHAGGEVA